MSQFTASVNMFVESAEKENILAALSKIEAIKEVYEVAGEYDIVSVISTSCMEEFRDLITQTNPNNQRDKKHCNNGDFKTAQSSK